MSISVDHNEFIWEQKYRPQSISECILPKSIKQTIQSFIDGGDIRHLLMMSTAGRGKTSLALSIVKELGADLLFLNGSNINIETVREDVIQFCASKSLFSDVKVVILDDCDAGNRQRGAMEALRPVMEQFSKTARFIITGNNINNVPEAIQSRCATIDFTIPKQEFPYLAKQMLDRVKQILELENVTYDDKVLVHLIGKYYPNNRKIISELQKYSVTGTIDVGILDRFNSDSISVLMNFIKDKKFTDSRKWVSDNSDIDPATFFKGIWDIGLTKLELNSIPDLVLILDRYQYQINFSVDREITYIACIVELMGNLRFK